uniref:Amino acid transporter transmembrane domain-containing protein n=1 Tax=Hordeum vulgare subsp. vulgare TaxID=112509 RepID=A0A8I6X4V9_HORVV
MSPATARGGAQRDQAGEAVADKDGTAEGGKGTWRHAAFHVATTIATPAAYAPLRPWAGLWVFAACYRLLAHSILGPWGYWYVSFFQQVASVGNNIAIQIAAGSSLKAVYTHHYSAGHGAMTLQHFILLFGAFELLLSHLPDIHSLRWVNATCTASTIGFAATAIGVAIYDGYRIDRNDVGYSLQGSNATKVFRGFNALGTIAFSFGDAMLPEIQSTVREPATTNMYKGRAPGYWAFGSGVQPYILSSLTVPRWAIVMANIFAVVQITGCFQYTAGRHTRTLKSAFRQRTRHTEHGWRLMYTSAYMATITLIAAAMPFFGDFVSVCGAVGFTPLDFVLPALAFFKAGKLPKNLGLRRTVKALCCAVAVLFSVIGVLACIGAIRAIALDVKTYKFFHDM